MRPAIVFSPCNPQHLPTRKSKMFPIGNICGCRRLRDEESSRTGTSASLVFFAEIRRTLDVAGVGPFEARAAGSSVTG